MMRVCEVMKMAWNFMWSEIYNVGTDLAPRCIPVISISAKSTLQQILCLKPPKNLKVLDPLGNIPSLANLMKDVALCTVIDRQTLQIIAR